MAEFFLVLPPGGDPFESQAYEELVFRRARGRSLLMLWENPLAVVIGKHQNLFGEVNAWEAWRRGLPVVRRESGGGAVTHAPGNLNYTMVTDEADGWSADAFAGLVAQAVRGLGADAQVFGSAAIAVSGRKVSGSAQRIAQGRVLHHGTLLFDADLRSVDGALARSPHVVSSRGTRSKPAAIGNIRPFLRRDMGLPEFKAALADALCGGSTMETGITAEEARELARDKYRSPEWMYGRNPAFEWRKEFFWRGVAHALEYVSEGGRISRISLTPAETPAASALETLVGAYLHPPAVAAALSETLGARDAESLAPHFFG